MAITSAICTSFKVELLEGDHDFNVGVDAFKCALMKAAASITGTYGVATTNYSDVTGNSDELAATGGYSTNGNTLTNIAPTSAGTTAYIDFADTEWTSATFTANGCLIFNDTASGDPSCCAIAFGGDKTVTSGTFTIEFPAATAGNAIIGIA